MFQELNQSNDVKARLAEILKLVNRMPLEKHEQKIKFAEFLINKYITDKEEEAYDSDEEKSEEEKENIEYIEENGSGTQKMHEV